MRQGEAIRRASARADAAPANRGGDMFGITQIDPTGLMKLLTLSVTLLAAGALRAEEAKTPPAPAKETPKLSLEEFEKKKAEKGAVVIDVRTSEEFRAGHVPGAVNVPLAAKDFDDRVARLDKDKIYLVHCQVGMRSAKAVARMRGVVDKLFEFPGGMKEWTKAYKPVEKGEAKSGSETPDAPKTGAAAGETEADPKKR
jgi:rhodanese-related sulfurtransferase